MDSKSLKDPGKHTTVSNVHSFMDLLNCGPPPPQYKTQTNKLLLHVTPMVAHTCSTPQNIPSVPSVWQMWRTDGILEAKRYQGHTCFSSKVNFCDWYRLSKDLSFSVLTPQKQHFSECHPFYLSWRHKLELAMSFLALLFFLREITAERWRNRER